jgi:hypothetical protein
MLQLRLPAGQRHSPARGLRTVLALLTPTIPALLLVQIYLAGLFLMGGVEARDAHVTVGRLLLVYPVALLVVALIARMPRRFCFALAAFWVAALVQGLLPQLSSGDATGWLRALHPLNGFFLVGLAVQLTRAAWSVARTEANAGQGRED